MVHRRTQIGRGIDERAIEIKDNSGGQTGHANHFTEPVMQSNAFNLRGIMAGQKA
jgi:hypothetical protein